MGDNVMYECKCCRKQYLDKQQAVDCESRHLKPVSIASSWYTEGEISPVFISVKMHNGSEVTYVRAFAKKFSPIVEMN